MEKKRDFVEEKPNNMYRTPKYIVCQNLGIISDNGDVELCSFDTFFRRTPERDAIYETLFEKRNFIDGKRLPSTITQREYVD